MEKSLLIFTVFFLISLFFASECVAKEKISRSWLWHSNPNEMVDTKKYKKKPPYIIGFSNSSATQNSWRVYFTRQVRAEIEKHPDLIKEFHETDANDSPVTQIANIEGLLEKGIDLLILSASNVKALDPVALAIMAKGIPVLCVDRRISKGNYVTFITASNYTQGRLQMLWLCEMLHGKGNVVMLAGIKGTGPVVERIAGAREILSQFPGIKVLDLKYANWSPVQGKMIMDELIETHGTKINGVWGDGLQNSGALEALHDANMKVPVTGDHLNGFLVKAQKFDLPAMSIDFPVSMGSDAVSVALKILQGIPVPPIINVPRTLLTTQDTENVKTDMEWSKVSHPERPDSSWINTLPKHLLPK